MELTGGYTQHEHIMWHWVGVQKCAQRIGTQTAKANCSANRRMDAMKTLGPVILLFALLLSAFAQADAQDSVITFYTTDTAGRDSAPIVYSNGQKIGEAIKGQFIRLSVRPGLYQFALTDDAPPTQQFSISIGGGQEIFLRVTRAAFFIGSAAEANASLRTVTPSTAPTNVPQVAALAVPRPDPRAQSAQVKQSV